MKAALPRKKTGELAERRILVAGGGGFLGQALTRCFCEAQADVSWLVRRKTHSPASVDVFYWSPRLNALPKGVFTDLVIATGTHGLPVGETGAKKLFQTHVAVPFQLICWAVETGVRRVIHISSGSVYERGASPLSDGDQALAAGFYPCAKLATETLLKPFRRNCSLHVVRLFRPYGPGEERSVVNRVLKRIRMGQRVSLTSSDGPLIQPVFVEDVGRVMTALLGMDGSTCINLAGRERLTLGNIARRYAAMRGMRTAFEILPEHAQHDRKVCGTGIRKLDALVTTSIEEGLQSI